LRRGGWPILLRVIFWLSLLGAIIGIFQNWYWAVVRGDVWPEVTFQAYYGFVLELVTVLAILSGFAGRRRLFATLGFLVGIINAFVTSFFFVQLAQELVIRLLAGTTPGPWLEKPALLLGWNLLALSLAVVATWYLWTRELHPSETLERGVALED
jgi:hypothetical protein